MKYRIDLTNYDVDTERWDIVDDKRTLIKEPAPVNVRSEFYEILRIPGVYKNGIETCDGVDLANRIKAEEVDFIDIESSELELIKRVFNYLISMEHKPQIGQIAMGGDRYIPLIQRVFKAKEVS